MFFIQEESGNVIPEVDLETLSAGDTFQGTLIENDRDVLGTGIWLVTDIGYVLLTGEKFTNIVEEEYGKITVSAYVPCDIHTKIEFGEDEPEELLVFVV